uniref:Putative secreted protein n=1 Tax=Amblyomma triste TaxID=251400 RepID=A0A023FZT1_AMBTT
MKIFCFALTLFSVADMIFGSRYTFIIPGPTKSTEIPFPAGEGVQPPVQTRNVVVLSDQASTPNHKAPKEKQVLPLCKL